MVRIDAHMHYMGDTAGSRQLLERFDLKMLNICVVEDSHGGWRSQANCYQALAEEHPHRFAWCTGFDLPDFTPDYVDRVIARLERDFAHGAIACKIWKNIGMEVRTPAGEYLLPDDALLAPIFDCIAAHNKTLLMHIADPLDCWRPLREDSPHYGYYSQHPEWHLYGQNDRPSHERLMEARDAVVARHPTLRVVGAHLASLEHDVAEVAKRFDAYPNFAVDMSARLLDLALQDPKTVRAFFLTYSDRILFGADMGTWALASELTTERLAAKMNFMTQSYEEHFRYLEQDGPMTIAGREVTGIGLPDEVLDRIYRTNAQHWYPGI